MSALSPSDYPAYAECISNKTQPPLGWGARPALLIVDVGAAYFSAASPLSLLDSTCGTGSALPRTVEALVAAARAGSCPVIWARTLFTSPKLRDAGRWAGKVSADVLDVFCDKSSKGMVAFLGGLAPQREVVEGAKTVPDLLIDKKFASAFFGTNLAMQLTFLGVDTLVFCGARTGGEIRQSILDAQGLGFRGIIAADACADTCKETHYANLFDIRAKMGDVVTSQEAVDGLQRGWSWPT